MGWLTPRLRGEPEPWPDAEYDSIALTIAVLEDDLIAAGAVLRNMDPGPVAVCLAKLLAAGLDEAGGVCCAYHFRTWSMAVLR